MAAMIGAVASTPNLTLASFSSLSLLFLLPASSSDEMDVLTACHDGYKPIIHQRTFEWNKIGRKLRVKDAFTQEMEWVSTLMLGKDVEVVYLSSESVELQSGGNAITISVNTEIDELKIEDSEVSTEYGVKCPSKAIRIYGHTGVCSMDLVIKLQ